MTKKRAETCEYCGRDLPSSEWCSFCWHDNHKLQVSGTAIKRIHKEIKCEQDLKDK